MASRCYYEVLAVRQDANASEIKKSYHAQALRYHPDKNKGDEEATEIFKQARRPSQRSTRMTFRQYALGSSQVQEAYEVLSNSQERAYYDDNREQVLMSDDEDEDEKETAEVEAELDLYKWASREAFVDFTHGATHAPRPLRPHRARRGPARPNHTRPPPRMQRSGGRFLLCVPRRLPRAARAREDRQAWRRASARLWGRGL